MATTPEPTVRYDRIGQGYAGTRQPDPRIQRRSGDDLLEQVFADAARAGVSEKQPAGPEQLEP